MAVKSDNPKTTIYVVNRGPESLSLSVVDGSGPLKEIKQLKLGGVIDVAVSGSRVYVSNWQAGKVHVIDGDTHAELLPIELPDPPALKHGLHGITVDDTGKRLLAARTYRSSPQAKINALTVIDTEARRVVGSFQVGPDPTHPVDVAVHPTAGRVYTANLGGASVPPGVAVLEPVPDQRDTYHVVDTLRTQAGAVAIAVDSARNHVYVAAGGGVQVIDAGQSEWSIVATIPTGQSAESVAIHPGTGHVFVGDRIEGTVT